MLDSISVLILLIGLLVYQVANINLFRRLITLKSNLGIVAIGFYKIGIVKKPIFITFLANSFNSLVLFTLSALFLAVSPRALKMAPNLSLISFI